MYNAEKTASRSEGLRARNVIQKNKPQSKYTRETEEEIINFKPWAHTQEKVANGNERKKNTKKKRESAQQLQFCIIAGTACSVGKSNPVVLATLGGVMSKCVNWKSQSTCSLDTYC